MDWSIVVRQLWYRGKDNKSKATDFLCSRMAVLGYGGGLIDVRVGLSGGARSFIEWKNLQYTITILNKKTKKDLELDSTVKKTLQIN